MSRRKRVERTLAFLGRMDAPGIARFLLERGITGNPSSSCDCPLARITGARIGGDGCARPPGHGWCMTPQWTENLPESCGQFIEMFDEGDAPSALYAPEPEGGAS